MFRLPNASLAGVARFDGPHRLSISALAWVLLCHVLLLSAGMAGHPQAVPPALTPPLMVEVLSDASFTNKLPVDPARTLEQGARREPVARPTESRVVVARSTQGPAFVAEPAKAALPTNLPTAQPAPAQQGSAAPVALAPPTHAQAHPVAPAEAPRFDADYLDNPKPTYPPISLREREQGTVLLDVHVEPGGMADTVVVRTSSGFERLDKAALTAVRRWRFVPARQGSEAISAWVVVPIVFSLKD